MPSRPGLATSAGCKGNQVKGLVAEKPCEQRSTSTDFLLPGIKYATARAQSHTAIRVRTAAWQHSTAQDRDGLEKRRDRTGVAERIGAVRWFSRGVETPAPREAAFCWTS